MLLGLPWPSGGPCCLLHQPSFSVGGVCRHLNLFGSITPSRLISRLVATWGQSAVRPRYPRFRLHRVATVLSLRTCTFPAVADRGDSSLFSCLSCQQRTAWRLETGGGEGGAQEELLLGGGGSNGMGLNPSSCTCEWEGLRQNFQFTKKKSKSKSKKTKNVSTRLSSFLFLFFFLVFGCKARHTGSWFPARGQTHDPCSGSVAS